MFCFIFKTFDVHIKIPINKNIFLKYNYEIVVYLQNVN